MAGDAEIYRSQPGLGVILGARVLAEFGDDPHRYADARSRKNYSGRSPITRASGTKKIVLARYARNRRLGDALFLPAYSALPSSPGARAYYDRHRAGGATHYQALRVVANRLVGILHGACASRIVRLHSSTLTQGHHSEAHVPYRQGIYSVVCGPMNLEVRLPDGEKHYYWDHLLPEHGFDEKIRTEHIYSFVEENDGTLSVYRTTNEYRASTPYNWERGRGPMEVLVARYRPGQWTMVREAH